jgi:hypothetical protein
MNDSGIIKRLFQFELEVAVLSFITPLLFGYENIIKTGKPFFDGGVSTCGPTWYMVVFGLISGLLGFALYYFFFEKLFRVGRPWSWIIFNILAILSAATSFAYVLCGF